MLISHPFSLCRQRQKVAQEVLAAAKGGEGALEATALKLSKLCARDFEIAAMCGLMGRGWARAEHCSRG